MISHAFPIWDISPSGGGPRQGRGFLCAGRGCLASVLGCVRSVWSGYEPLRDELHAAARLQGAGFDPWFVSLRARPRWLRGSLLLSGLGSTRDRRRWKCVDGGNRGADRTLRPVFGTARAVGVGAVRDERDAQGR